jgi:non-ribosomal peptide synthase protein (TIGR01720 family)
MITLYVGADILSSKNTSLVNDSLLIATVAAIADWSGRPMVAIDVEHHGRGGHVPGLDFLEVVGPTTFKFPMWFEIEPDSLSSSKSFEALRKRITEVTQYGLGYGFLRYLHPEQGLRSDFQRMQRPQVFFNNRTTLFSKGGAQEKELAVSQRKSGLVRIESHGDPELHDPYSHELLIECDSAQDGIEISLIYSEKIHKDATVVELAETLLAKLRRIADACV